MCNCIKETEKRLFEHFERENKDKERKLISVDLLGISIHFLPPTGITVTHNEVEVIYEKPKKGGGVKTTKWKPYVSHTFCPFCGVKYKEEKEVSSGQI